MIDSTAVCESRQTAAFYTDISIPGHRGYRRSGYCARTTFIRSWRTADNGDGFIRLVKMIIAP